MRVKFNFKEMLQIRTYSFPPPNRVFVYLAPFYFYKYCVCLKLRTKKLNCSASHEGSSYVAYPNKQKTFKNIKLFTTDQEKDGKNTGHSNMTTIQTQY